MSRLTFDAKDGSNATVTAAKVLQNPAFLTRNANPGHPIKSFEGLVGNVLADTLVTSPNMAILYKPPLNECRVRMRRDRHFGSDDPLHYPQPWNRELAHLAVIRVQSNLHEEPCIDTAWHIPSTKDFVQSPGCGGLGRLDRRIRERFSTFCCSIQLNRLLDRLDCPASESQALLRFACAQRQALELLAWFDWVDRYKKLYMGKSYDRLPVVNNAIMGAFVEKLDDLDSLFHAGIPVWYVRRFSDSPDVRVDCVTHFIDNTFTQKLPLRFGGELDTSDDPACSKLVIYTGMAGKPERYLHMLSYMRSLFQYPSLLGSSEVRSSTSVVRSARMSVPPTAFGAVAGGNISNPKSKQSKPYHRKAPKGAKTNTTTTTTTTGDANMVNPFTYSSPLLPPSIPSWSDALQALSHNNLSSEPPPGQVRRYFVPPPRTIVSPIRDDSKLEVLRNWLKIRDVVKFRISSAPCRLSAKEWRRLLNIAGGDSKQASTSTATGQRHDMMLTELKKFLDSHSLSLRYSELPGLPAVWKGVTLSNVQLPEKSVVQDIMWELFELGFRQDLLTVDAVLDQSGMSCWERQNLLDRCWKGQAESVSGFEGLGSASFETRIPYLRVLHKVLSTWRGDKQVELLDPFPSNSDAHTFVATCQCVERAIAMFYTSSCFIVLGREAQVPHLPPVIT
ncbi:hypothetical protein V5O48_017680 [Marasmius crinis-equi]|uniref:Uncharacterized protein n=1 Tax=Marasmius crinis-equi TaxID=585013 RepID=A0ABR3ENC5_9AGAR